MKFDELNPPRKFKVGGKNHIELSDCGSILLSPDEQITFKTETGAEYDVARKIWGFYATPSLNGRLQNFGLRAMLVKSSYGKYNIFLVEKGKETACERYIKKEGHKLVCWLDSDKSLKQLEDRIKSSC
jgi:hypothetical protein